MEEPLSPTMVNNISFENDSMSEMVLNKAGYALESIKGRLGKTTINVADALLDFIHYNEQDNYEQSLFGAISATLDKAPKSKFTLVAVSSSAGNPSEQAERAANARNDVSKLISSLISMGMPADRISVSSLSVANVENTEVRLYAD